MVTNCEESIYKCDNRKIVISQEPTGAWKTMYSDNESDWIMFGEPKKKKPNIKRIVSEMGLNEQNIVVIIDVPDECKE